MYVGLDLEFSHTTSTSAQAIRRGALIAIAEINARGGVLHGRPLRVIEMDNHSIPARAVENIRKLSATPDLVAVVCGKFGPATLESLPIVHELKLPLLDPWASPDAIVENGYRPNFVFRLSLNDKWAMPAMLRHAARRGFNGVGLLLPNTSWGRSNDLAAKGFLETSRDANVVATRWYNMGDTSLLGKYQELRGAGAQVIIAVVIEAEGAVLVKQVAALPRHERLPIISHHGIVGGDLAALTGPALRDVDLTIIQPFTFSGRRTARAQYVLDAARRLFGIDDPARLPSPAGTATTYDLVHLLALAIDKANSTDRSAIRDALERLSRHDGLVKSYAPPFTPKRHEALAPSDVVFTRFDVRGVLVPVR